MNISRQWFNPLAAVFVLYLHSFDITLLTDFKTLEPFVGWSSTGILDTHDRTQQGQVFGACEFDVGRITKLIATFLWDVTRLMVSLIATPGTTAL